jgi:hypothetical protein
MMTDPVLTLLIAQEVERLMTIEDPEERREETLKMTDRMRGVGNVVLSLRQIRADPVVSEFLAWVVSLQTDT